MDCIFCGDQTRIVDSRRGKDEVIRRRKCLACEKTFYTSEKLIDYHEGKKRYRELKKAWEAQMLF